ncbi:hypothetical protein chiPu_0001398 [Chiloscyllium punctatum]|uniref:Uncharacterized protein n=1 Tax=Chiloscyllium punctatum TaxID=137246 RepID=A0A401RXX2_CHIPU|nr:hypothetical protein [Chiloscyllium punctatum]
MRGREAAGERSAPSFSPVPGFPSLQGEMLKLFGIQKSTESSKKSAQPDEEVDGFVILGETASERQHVPVEDVTGKCSQSTKEVQYIQFASHCIYSS